MVFLPALAVGLYRLGREAPANGFLFRVFLTAYLGWRLAIDFLKPDRTIGGLSPIQWSCLGGLLCVMTTRRQHA